MIDLYLPSLLPVLGKKTLGARLIYLSPAHSDALLLEVQLMFGVDVDILSRHHEVHFKTQLIHSPALAPRDF